MSHFSIRASIAAGLVTAIALSGCSSSESSGVRTRNSASVSSCIGVWPLTSDSIISASITTPECATGLVDVSPRHFNPAINTSNTEPYADRRDPDATTLSYSYNYKAFDVAYEARDKDNNPIEYVRSRGNGYDNGSITYSRSTVSPISQADSCIQPSGIAGALGFNPMCDEIDSFQSTIYVGPEGSQRILYELTDIRGVYNFQVSDSRFPVGLGYYSVLGLQNGIPHTRMTITRPDATTLSVKSFRYTEPTITYQYSEESPTSSSTTSTPIDETSSTIASEESSTTSVATTPALATYEQVSAACDTLDGVEVFPGLDNWNESTRFEISVANDCMRRIGNGEFYGAWTNHRLRAVNKTDGRKVYFDATGTVSDRIQFNGRLYAGQWKLTVEQRAYASSSDQMIDTYSVLNVNVSVDTENPWKICSASDIQWDGTRLSLNCTYSIANIDYPTTANNRDNSAQLPIGSGESITLPNLKSGWQPASIEISVDGFTTRLLMTLCADNCVRFPSSTPVTVTRNKSSVTVTPEDNECLNDAVPFVGVYFMTKINNALMVHSPRLLNSYIDAILNSGASTTFALANTVDHLLAFDFEDEESNCEQGDTIFGTHWSIIPIPEEITSTENIPAVTVPPSPPNVDLVEFSRTDSNGSPVIISNDQTVIEIPVAALPNSLSDANSSVQSVSVRVGGDKWTRVSQQLPTLVAVNKDASAMEVKYEFEDGSEAVVTKPLQDADEYDQKVKESESSSSSSFPMFAIIALVVIVAGGGALVIRRRK